MSRQVLIFGTSNTLGCFDEKGGWADRLKQFCMKKQLKTKDYWCLVYNLGISGNTSKDIVERFEAETKARNKDTESSVVILDVGTNDSLFFNGKQRHWVAPEEYESNLRWLAKHAATFVPNVFFKKLLPVYEPAVDPVPWVPEASYKTEYVNRYNEILAAVSADTDVPIIDPTPVFKDPLENCFVDGVHPTSEMHEKIFEIVRDELVQRNLV